MTDMKPLPDFDAELIASLPSDEVFAHTVFPEPQQDRALLGRQLVAAGFRSRPLELAAAEKQIRRQRRAQLVAAVLGGAVAAVVWLKAVDRG